MLSLVVFIRCFLLLLLYLDLSGLSGGQKSVEDLDELVSLQPALRGECRTGGRLGEWRLCSGTFTTGTSAFKQLLKVREDDERVDGFHFGFECAGGAVKLKSVGPVSRQYVSFQVRINELETIRTSLKRLNELCKQAFQVFRKRASCWLLQLRTYRLLLWLGRE